MRTSLILLLLLACLAVLPAQQFDVVQLQLVTKGYGVPTEVTVLGAVRLNAAATDHYEQDWRSALVAQQGALTTIRDLRVSASGPSYVLMSSMGSRRRRSPSTTQLDAHKLSVVGQPNYFGQDRTELILLASRADESQPLALPTVEDLLERLTSPLLPRTEKQGMAGQLLQRLREVLPLGQHVVDEQTVVFLSSLPLARLLQPVRYSELRAALAQESEGLSKRQRRWLRHALSDADVLAEERATAEPNLDAVTGAHFSSDRHADPEGSDFFILSISMHAGWAGAMDAKARGAFAWALYEHQLAANSSGDSKVAIPLHEEVLAGTAVLPGDDTTREQRRALLQRFAEEADARPALYVFIGGVVALALLLLGLRRLTSSLLH